MIILAFDPSGSFKEGKGQTGWVCIKDDQLLSYGLIKAKDFKTKYDYFEEHIKHIKSVNPNIVVMENFRLYGHKANSLIGSELETAKLIGVMQHHLDKSNRNYVMQMAAQVKTRFTDNILINKKYITKDVNGRYYINGVNVAGHIIDALRHALFYMLKEKLK